MFIEEDPNTPTPYSPTSLEHQLIEGIMDSFHNHLTGNASFLAERLLCEHDTEEFRSLLAECYLKENKPHKVCHLLKDCKTDYARYQLAVAYLRCGKIKEAERALVGLMPNLTTKTQGQIPNGAFGHYLLAQIFEKQNRTAEAKEHYLQALDINPTLWIAFERLTKLGEVNMGNKIFSDQKQKKYEITRKAGNCNILSTITNIMRNRSTSSKLGNSAQKDTTDEEENKRDEMLEQKSKNLQGRFSMATSQIVNPQNIHQFGINMDDSSNYNNKNSLQKSRQPKNPQSINFTNYQNLLQQPLTYQQQGRITAQKKSSHQDVQRVGSSALHQNQPFTAQAMPQQINSIASLLRTLAVPLQMWTVQHSDAINSFMKLPPNQYKSGIYYQRRLGWVLERVARCFMDQVRYVEAEKIWKELRELEPNRLEGMDYYSSCLWNLKKQTELTYLAHACLQVSHLAPETWIALGNCFSLNKENENSLKHFNRAIQLKPDNAYAHTLSGHEYVQIEDFSKAQRCYEAALTLDNQQYNAWWGLGNISYKREKYDQAITFFKKAITVNQRNSVIYCFLGMAYAAKNDHLEALKQYQASEQIDPKNGMNKFEKANSLVKLEQYEAALNELKSLELMLPREPQIFLLMGKIYKKLNKINESYKCFSNALSLENKDQQRIKGMIDSLNNQDNEFNDDFDL